MGRVRGRGTDLMKGIAGKHARMMGMHNEADVDKLLKIMHDKDDYYFREKFPDQAIARQAEDDYNNFMTGTSAMNVMADDMRRFYGLQAKAAPAAPVTNAPVTTAPVEPVVRTINITKPQGPKAPPAQGPRRSTAPKPVQDFKNAKVQQVIDTNPNVSDAKTQEI